MTRSVVFDFGAVLFEWQPQVIVHAALPDRAPDPAAARSLATAIFGHADWQAFDSGRLTLDDVVCRTAVRLDLPFQELGAMIDSIPGFLAPIEVTVKLLTELKARQAGEPDLRLFFLSNMPMPFARVLESRHAFLSWFDGGIFSGDVGLAKPDPAIFGLAESRHGLRPESTLFIDDHLANVEAARARGWSAIHCLSPAELRSAVLRHLDKT